MVVICAAAVSAGGVRRHSGRSAATGACLEHAAIHHSALSITGGGWRRAPGFSWPLDRALSSRTAGSDATPRPLEADRRTQREATRTRGTHRVALDFGFRIRAPAQAAKNCDLGARRRHATYFSAVSSIESGSPPVGIPHLDGTCAAGVRATPRTGPRIRPPTTPVPPDRSAIGGDQCSITGPPPSRTAAVLSATSPAPPMRPCSGRRASGRSTRTSFAPTGWSSPTGPADGRRQLREAGARPRTPSCRSSTGAARGTGSAGGWPCIQNDAAPDGDYCVERMWHAGAVDGLLQRKPAAVSRTDHRRSDRPAQARLRTVGRGLVVFRQLGRLGRAELHSQNPRRLPVKALAQARILSYLSAA